MLFKLNFISFENSIASRKVSFANCMKSNSLWEFNPQNQGTFEKFLKFYFPVFLSYRKFAGCGSALSFNTNK